MIPITVAIPVGPMPHHREHLEELLESIERQTELPSEILIINDGGPSVLTDLVFRPTLLIKQFDMPWNCGCVAAWNCAVGLARNEHVLLCGADDMLFPKCIESLWDVWLRCQDLYGYYYLGVRYSEREKDQNTPCNAAMVTKTLWRHTGGFPTQAAVGAPDHIFQNMMLIAMRENRTKMKNIRVSDDVLYWYRVGSQTETTKNIWPAIEAVKDWTGANWRPRDR